MPFFFVILPSSLHDVPITDAAPPVETLHRRLSGPGSPPATVVAQPPVEVFAPGRAEGAPPPFHFAFPPVEVRDEPTP